MKQLMPLLFFFLLMHTACDNSIENVPQVPVQIELAGNEQAIVADQNNFAMELFAQVYEAEKMEKENLLISPFSLHTALAMLSNGAEGNTKAEIFSAMKMKSYTQDELNAYFCKMTEGLVLADPAVVFGSANSIWCNKDIRVKEDFVQVNKEQYQAKVASVDFASPSAKDQINQWCSETTNGKISRVIETTSPSAVAYLLNALYFKARWENEFQKNKTYGEIFTSEKGTDHKVPFMHKEELTSYMQNDLFAMAAMPYINGTFKMHVILPAGDVPMSDVVSALSKAGYWQDCVRESKSFEVKFSLPRFKVDYEIELNSILQQAGMNSAFVNGQADFSRLTDDHFFVSEVKQLACLSVDEEGSEGAAVTVIKGDGAPLLEKAVFNANRPFLFMISENVTGAILFMGKTGMPL